MNHLDFGYTDEEFSQLKASLAEQGYSVVEKDGLHYPAQDSVIVDHDMAFPFEDDAYIYLEDHQYVGLH